MTTPKRPPRRQGNDLPCGQKGCYHPETARDLRWCVYANYWQYSCQKPDDMKVVPPPPPPKRGPDQEGQIGAPVRFPTGFESDPPARDPGPQDEEPTLEELEELEDPEAEEQEAEEQELEEAPDQGDAGDSDDAGAGAADGDDTQDDTQGDTQDEALAYAIPAQEPTDQAEPQTPEPGSTVPEPVKAFQTAFAI
jgi:hypothetical protein